MKYFKPHYFFEHYSKINPSWLKENNIKTILSDLDGTLAPHNELGDELFEEWLKELEKQEISLIIVSNNHQERVEKFTSKYKLVGYAKCQKPLTKMIEQELFNKGLEPETTIFLGDQLFTDVWCGKNLGIKTALVKPIAGNDPINIRFKRKFENILLKNWRK